jgi:UDP-glucose 4-epimerase
VLKVLVTGGSGFIGHHLTKELISEKYKIVIVDSLANSNECFMNELKKNKNIHENMVLYKQDIRNKQALFDIFKHENIDTCIHLAALSSVQDSITKPLETIQVNVIGTLNLLEACCDNNVDNFVFASSAAVYGHPKTLPISEDHRTQPISPYGASKVAGEALVSSFRSSLKNCQILRFFNVYGKGQTSHYAGVITKFMERLSNRLPPIIYGKGNQTRDFVHVSDIVQAIILVAEGMPNLSDSTDNVTTFNIGTGKPTSVLELANMLIDIYGLGGKLQPIFSDPIAGDIIHSYADLRKSKDLLKFSAKEDLRSGLTKQHVLQDQSSQ